MLTYGYIDIIARDVYDSLDIPEDIYLTFNKDSIKSFQEQYLDDTSYLYPLVDAEIAKYDTAQNSPADIQDIKESAVEIVKQMINENIEDYYNQQRKIVLDTYREIVEVLEKTAFSNVIDVDVEYEPADPDVGIYREDRSITFTLSNGAIISMEVTIDEDGV